MNPFNLFSKILLILSFIVLGCAKERAGGQAASQIGDPVGEPKPPSATTIPRICSALDFEDVSWPNDYSDDDQMAFALAMNITGSFEGHAGWTNLSNNFDGQGFSMGILNQNLGSGTLQPLLVHMRDNHPSVLAEAMTQTMLNSLLAMLQRWQEAQPVGVLAQNISEEEVDRRLVLSDDLNIDKKYASTGFRLQSTEDSVSWAKATLYSDSNGRNFKPEWKKALKQIAGHPAYVSQQILAAQFRHDRAIFYKERLGWKQLRSYLFLFDIVVQNGALRDKHFEKFDHWLAEQTGATEEEQMLEMLEIRVVDSHPKWQKDVRLRKRAIILGSGFVHGEDRNLPVEYCYDPVISY